MSEKSDNPGLVECNTSHSLGDNNIQLLGLDIHNPVFLIAAGVVVSSVALTLAMPEAAGEVFGAARNWAITQLDWLFAASVNIYLLFCIAIALLPVGGIRIGGADAVPEYRTASWIAMMFAAGVGIGMMFFGVLEPVTHALNPPLGMEGLGFEERKMLGVAGSIFHWGLHAWGIYAVAGLAMAIFAFNYGLPLTVRSVFYPLFGERVWGWPGHIIDVLAVFATLCGLATSLGVGAKQTAAGLNYLFTVPNDATTQVAVIGVITFVALVSVILGMNRGVKRLSEFNCILVVLLVGFVLLAGPTLSILGKILDSAVEYLRYLPSFSNWVGREDYAFIHDWSTVYWAWWIAWSPFVGMFIARVSKGRTVREFILAALLVPTLVNVVWFGAFGNSALIDLAPGVETAVTQAVIAEDADVRAQVLFKFLEGLPIATISSVVALLLIIIFFVTSLDSGSLVVDSITAGGKTNAPLMQRIFWCTFLGLVAIALLLGGGEDGLGGLQAAVLATGFPFIIVLLAMMVCLYIGLRRIRKDSGK